VNRNTALAAVCAVLFLTFLDNTIIGVALADMQTSLSASVPALQWIVDGYMLAFTALMLTGGTLGDILGRKRVMLAGIVLFCGGSLLGALATSSGVLIGARVLMGVGAAACEPGTLSLIRHIFPERRERARALGVWTAVSGVSIALGPVLGGLLVAAGGWQYIFWFNVGFGLVVLVAAAAFVPESSDPEGRSLDVPGLAAGAIALIDVTFAVIEGERVGYHTWWVVLLFAVALVAAVGFVFIERSVRDPVLRLSFFRIPAFAGSTAVGFATSFGLFAVFYFTALYLQVVAAVSASRIALEFVAMTVAMVVAGIVAGAWTAARGPRGPMTTGCVVAAGSLVGVAQLLNPHPSLLALGAVLAATGCGLGLALVSVSAAVLNVVPAERSGMGASTLNTSREFGGVLAIAILGAIVNGRLVSEMTHKLTALGVPAAYHSLIINAVTHGGLPANVAAAAKQNPLIAADLALATKVLAAATAAFGHGLEAALYLAAAILLAGAVVAAATTRSSPSA
jgi:EmrB/QacA subfamily drug resistance transporter